jgi:hypothetical protein
MQSPLFTIDNGTAHSTFKLKDLRREARAAVKAACKRGKLIGYTVQFREHTGRVTLIASYETAPNQQTFTTVAL